MTEDRVKQMIMGHMVKLNPNRGTVPGTIVNPCNECGEKLYMSPSAMIEDGDFLCAVCMAKHWRDDPPDDTEIHTNDVQIEELKGAGFDPAKLTIDALRDAVTYECYAAQQPGHPDKMKHGKFFWCLGSIPNKGKVVVSWTDGTNVEKTFLYGDPDKAMKGLEAIFLEGKEEPGGHDGLLEDMPMG